MQIDYEIWCLIGFGLRARICGTNPIFLQNEQGDPNEGNNNTTQEASERVRFANGCPGIEHGPASQPAL